MGDNAIVKVKKFNIPIFGHNFSLKVIVAAKIWHSYTIFRGVSVVKV